VNIKDISSFSDQGALIASSSASSSKHNHTTDNISRISCPSLPSSLEETTPASASASASTSISGLDLHSAPTLNQDTSITSTPGKINPLKNSRLGFWI